MEIELSCDTVDGEKFVEWLKNKGHNAKIGSTTGNYIDGCWTFNHEKSDEIMRELWDEFCNE